MKKNLLILTLLIICPLKLYSMLNADPNYEKFNKAISKANTQKIRNMIANGIDLNPSTWETISSYLDIAIKKATRAFKQDSAVKYERLNIIEILIQAGANVNWEGKYNCSPLLRAVNLKHPQFEIIKKLIENGAEVSIEDLKRAYKQQKKCKNLEHIINLLEENISATLAIRINDELANRDKNNNNLTLIEEELSEYNPSLKLITFLLKNNAKISKFSLEKALKHPKIYESLWYHMEKINSQLKTNQETLCDAIKFNLPNMVKILIKKGLPIKFKYLRKAKKHSSLEAWIVLIEYFRVFSKFGAKDGPYGSISKNGIVGVHGIHMEIAEYIARFV